MTREEAITVFKAFMDNPLFSDIHKAAFSIAIHDIKQSHDWDINKLMLVPKTEWEQEPQTFKWCTDCREYDQEKHCCHRWSKVIRDTVEEMKQEQEPKTGHWKDIPKYKDIAWQCSECGHFTTMKHNYCPNCGCRMVEPQESEEV